MTHIWQKLKKKYERPLIVLAPMADVTDAAFRLTIAKQHAPDMLWTEFVSADGLMRATPEGKVKLLRDLVFDSGIERPIVAQLFGSRPEYMEQAAYLVASLGYDGIDINMGCPDRSIEKQGCGSAMIKNPKMAQEIVCAAQAGAKRAFEDKVGLAGSIEEVRSKFGDKTEVIDEPIPVSVKTRIGYNKDELDTWIPALLETKLALITVHARTRKEMSKVTARWEHVAEAVWIRNQVQADVAPEHRTLIFGNGDIESSLQGVEKCLETSADGAMLGRAIFGNPWLFTGLSETDCKEQYVPTLEERLHTAIAHAERFETILGDVKNFAIMKKHFKAYINGFDGAKELRQELMDHAENAQGVRQIIGRFLKEGK
jgi:tRNA-dihydrouridine synthase B